MVIVTGASDGLGKEIANLFLSSGKRVIGLSRSKCIDGVEHIETNLRDDDSIEKAAQVINSDSEKIEALINCAGVLSIEKLENLSITEIDRVLDTNIRAPLILTSKLINKIKQDGADIVNVASTVGLKGYVDQAAYGASKWAMRGFSANLQVELKDTSCRVISFCVGGFKSKLFEKATGVDNIGDPSVWMDPKDIAVCMRQLLDLPKNIEISEVILNRKQTKQ